MDVLTLAGEHLTIHAYSGKYVSELALDTVSTLAMKSVQLDFNKPVEMDFSR